MPWIVVNAANAIVSGPHDELPTAGEGERVEEVALGCEWSEAKGAWEDAALWMTKLEWVMLWTDQETADAKASTDVALSAYWTRFQAWEGKLNAKDDRVKVGVDRAVVVGILTEARAARIKAGLPPEA